MMKTSNMLAVFAIVIGISCLVVDTWSNLEFIGFAPLSRLNNLLQIENWNSLMAAVVAVAAANAISLCAALHCWRNKLPILGFGLLVAFVVGAGFSLSATLDRVASARDASVEDRQSHNIAIDRKTSALTSARQALKGAEEGIVRECASAPVHLKGWPMCHGHKTTAQTTRLEIAQIQLDLSRLGVEQQADPMGARVAAVIPWLTPQQVQLFQPLLLPVALFLSGNLLIAFGVVMLPAGGNSTIPSPIPKMTNSVIDVTPQPTRSEQISQFCLQFIEQHGREPTFTEVRDATKLPASTVSKYRQQALVKLR